jgi:hypothetical protein
LPDVQPPAVFAPKPTSTPATRSTTAMRICRLPWKVSVSHSREVGPAGMSANRAPPAMRPMKNQPLQSKARLRRRTFSITSV